MIISGLSSEESEQKVELKKSKEEQIMVQCPNCHTLETLFFYNNRLKGGVKFYQKGERIYHDCGTRHACHLYRITNATPKRSFMFSPVV